MSPNKSIIVDTCVIQTAGHHDRFKSIAINNCFNTLEKKSFELTISEITIFENLQGLWGQKAIRASKSLAKFQTKVISREVLAFASMLGGLYGQQRKDISVCDKIIAATAFLAGSLILTENHDDFPPPYFFQYEWIPISYEKGITRKTIDLALLQANSELISRTVNSLDK